MNAMLKSSKQFMPTYMLIALNVAFYAYTSIISGNFLVTGDDALTLYGQYNLIVLNGGYWQLFTSMFVHVNIMHLAGNMLFLLIFGLRAEEMFSLEEYLLVYFLSGLSGNLASLLLGPEMISAGASGAIFGLFGACTVYVRRAIGQSIMSALIFAFFLLLISSGPEVNNLAHIGGLIVGVLIGYELAVTRRAATTHGFNYSFSTQG